MKRSHFFIFVILHFFYLNVYSQSISIGGGLSFSSHSFLEFTDATSLVYNPITGGDFESFGQSFFVTVSPNTLEHLFSVHTGYGKKLLKKGGEEFLGISYLKFDYTFMYNLIAVKNRQPGGSFGIGVSTINSSIRRSWLQVPAIELGGTYDRQFWDVGFNANFLGSYGLKYFSIFLGVSTNYYLKTTLLDLHSRLGIIFTIKR